MNGSPDSTFGTNGMVTGNAILLSNLFPPYSGYGKAFLNAFLMQTNLMNMITWTVPTNGVTPTRYELYRDAALTDFIATVPATSPLQYYDGNRQPYVTYSYYIVSAYQSGTPDQNDPTSSPIVITISS